MTPEDQEAQVRQRLIDLTRELRVVEHELEGVTLPPDILGEFKSAIDQMRLNAWLLMVEPDGEYDPEAAARFRSHRLACIVMAVAEDLEKGLLDCDPTDASTILRHGHTVLAALGQEPVGARAGATAGADATP